MDSSPSTFKDNHPKTLKGNELINLVYLIAITDYNKDTQAMPINNCKD